MATNTEQYGPKGVRMECIQLTLIDTESEHTGWREPNKGRQETLKNIFLGGQYGLSVSNKSSNGLIAMAEDMGSWLWPQWNQTVVQSKKRDIQSHRIKPHYAVVIAPVQDVSHEPIVLALPKVPQTVRRVHIRGRHVRTHGATRGCEGCMAAMRGENARDHTEPCRNGFMQVFESPPQGRVRIFH